MGCSASSSSSQDDNDNKAEPKNRMILRIDLSPDGGLQTGRRIDLRLRPDAAPVTVQYMVDAVQAGLYNQGRATFYRSDFVIQCGLHGSGVVNPQGDVPRNETKSGRFVSNTAGTAAVAHFDVPDNGNTEFFINLKHNKHLDRAYGGYCVFAEVADEESMKTCQHIAALIPQGTKPKVLRMSIVNNEG